MRPNCKFKHVYGTTGAFSAVAAQVLHGEGIEISCHDFGNAAIELNPQMDAWEISPEKEDEVAPKVAIACGIMADDEESMSQFKAWCDLGGQGFQGQRR